MMMDLLFIFIQLLVVHKGLLEMRKAILLLALSVSTTDAVKVEFGA